MRTESGNWFQYASNPQGEKLLKLLVQNFVSETTTKITKFDRDGREIISDSEDNQKDVSSEHSITNYTQDYEEGSQNESNLNIDNNSINQMDFSNKLKKSFKKTNKKKSDNTNKRKLQQSSLEIQDNIEQQIDSNEIGSHSQERVRKRRRISETVSLEKHKEATENIYDKLNLDTKEENSIPVQSTKEIQNIYSNYQPSSNSPSFSNQGVHLSPMMSHNILRGSPQSMLHSQAQSLLQNTSNLSNDVAFQYTDPQMLQVGFSFPLNQFMSQYGSPSQLQNSNVHGYGYDTYTTNLNESTNNFSNIDHSIQSHINPSLNPFYQDVFRPIAEYNSWMQNTSDIPDFQSQSNYPVPPLLLTSDTYMNFSNPNQYNMNQFNIFQNRDLANSNNLNQGKDYYQNDVNQ